MVKKTLFVVDFSDDTQEGRKIRITKNGTLNIYIGVDISESIDKEHIENARQAITKLITKVRNKQLAKMI